jgi:hypothetical protein
MVKKAKVKVWVMPAWMEPFRDCITNTGNNPVEDLMNNHEATVYNNCVLAALCIAVKAQVEMLERAHAKGLL